jgi:hypothetical protein
MMAIETLGERGEDDPISAGDCLSADALDDCNWWQNDPLLTDLLNERSRPGCRSPDFSAFRPKSYGLVRRHLWCDGVRLRLAMLDS